MNERWCVCVCECGRDRHRDRDRDTERLREVLSLTWYQDTLTLFTDHGEEMKLKQTSMHLILYHKNA